MTFLFIGNPLGWGPRGRGKPGEGGAGRGLWQDYYWLLVHIYKYIYKYINIFIDYIFEHNQQINPAKARNSTDISMSFK